MASLNGPGVTQALLAALIATADAAERAGDVDWPRRAGIALGRALAARRGPAEMDTRGFARLAAQALRYLAPASTLVEAGDERVVLAMPAPRLGDELLTVRERVIRGALGALAAHHFGRALVRVEPRVVDGEPAWLCTVNLRASADEAGEEYLAAELGHPDGPTGEEEGPSAERLRALGELAVSMAHGLNNVLGAIAGHAADLEQAADEERAGAARAIRQAAADGAAMARRVLRASRGQPVAETTEQELLDLDDLVRDALRMVPLPWRGGPVRRGGAVEPRLELGQPPSVRGVAADLREAIVNLVTNALDAMPAGGSLTLATRAAGRQAVLECRDTGQGMPAEVRERVFDPFFTTKGAHGTGMGLPIVYGIVARHGGDLEVESEVGRGTRVIIRLPTASLGARASRPQRGFAALPHEIERSSTRQSRKIGRAARGCGRDARAPRELSILLVDDDRRFRTAFAKRLAIDGHGVTAVGSAREALDQLSVAQWDLICVDERLPDAAGTELARQLRARLPTAFVALVSGFATGVDDAALRSGAIDAVLPKPCKDDELEALLGRVAGSQDSGSGRAPRPPNPEP